MTLANSITTVTIHLADDPDRCDAPSNKGPVGSYSGLIVEGVLDTLLCVAVLDVSALVRLGVVRSLDARYDAFLSQTHHLQPLILLLQDKLIATKAAGLQLLGRLSAIFGHQYCQSCDGFSMIYLWSCSVASIWDVVAKRLQGYWWSSCKPSRLNV